MDWIVSHLPVYTPAPLGAATVIVATATLAFAASCVAGVRRRWLATVAGVLTGFPTLAAAVLERLVYERYAVEGPAVLGLQFAAASHVSSSGLALVVLGYAIATAWLLARARETQSRAIHARVGIFRLGFLALVAAALWIWFQTSGDWPAYIACNVVDVCVGPFAARSELFARYFGETYLRSALLACIDLAFVCSWALELNFIERHATAKARP